VSGVLRQLKLDRPYRELMTTEEHERLGRYLEESGYIVKHDDGGFDWDSPESGVGCTAPTLEGIIDVINESEWEHDIPDMPTRGRSA
jgi:hypothetical protein